MLRFLIPLSLLLFTLTFPNRSFAQQQSTISGTVYEAAGKETVPGAHVFLNGTTLGTTTNENGTFNLPDIPEGVYQLIVKFLGFRDYVIQINTLQNTEGLEIYLEENVYELNEITVTSNSKEWKEHYNIFESYFLGTSDNAKDTEIINPEVLNFDMNPETRTLTAEAYESLKIKNDALGYSIAFYLEHFSYNLKEGISSYYGFPVFKELESKRRRTNRRWERNRKSTYNGSFQHFITSLIEGNHSEEGFEIRAEMRKSRKEVAREALDSTSVTDSTFAKNEILGGGARYLSRDTVDMRNVFYQKDDNTYVLKFVNFLNVTYLKENESYAYRKWLNGKFAEKNPLIVKPQNSVVTLKSDSLLIDKSGFIYNATDYLLGGYWSFERLSDLMPINYKPLKN